MTYDRSPFVNLIYLDLGGSGDERSGICELASQQLGTHFAR